ncbi:MAG TPA: SAM-dependent methyltransferase [Gammaproteobacteria bacterium]
MKRLLRAFMLAMTLAVVPLADSAAQADLDAILADPSRPEEDRARDESRKPAEVLEFLGIGPGDRVADLLAGGGYWTRILVPLVGPEGRVYAGNNPFFARFYAEQFDALLREPAFARVVRIDGPVDEIDLPADASLDAALMSLAYHDLFLTDEDRAAMNRKIFAALKPGGVFGVIDHQAAEGAGTDAAESLHRIPQDVVIEEVRAAGFVLAGEGDFLRNPEDDHTRRVFDPAIAGRTDRFVLRFEKPR